MQARDVKTIEDAIALVEARHLTHVKVAVADIDGILRGKYLTKEKFYSVLKSELAFCNVVLGWDSEDQLYDNVKYTGADTAIITWAKRIPHRETRCTTTDSLRRNRNIQTNSSTTHSRKFTELALPDRQHCPSLARLSCVAIFSLRLEQGRSRRSCSGAR